MSSTEIDELAEQLQARRSIPPQARRAAIRRAAGASLADVAKACGVSKQAVAFWEAGLTFPRGEHLLAYAEVLRLFRGRQ